MFKCFFFHNYSKWRVIKKSGFMDTVYLYRIRVCQDCGKIQEKYLQPIDRKDAVNIKWYYEEVIND
ncbi:MAG: hypothetical protein ACRCZ0_09605 [Cetobacterium sp.]